MKNDINKLLSKREILEHKKRTLEDYLKDIKKDHVSGRTWDIWENIVNTNVLWENKDRTEQKFVVWYSTK